MTSRSAWSSLTHNVKTDLEHKVGVVDRTAKLRQPRPMESSQVTLALCWITNHTSTHIPVICVRKRHQHT